MEPLHLHPDRYFDADPTVRVLARGLYDGIRDCPIVSPHGHVDPALLAEDRPFPNPAALLIIPDHYVFRMLYSQGVPLEQLGVPSRDGAAVETDPRAIWRRFAAHYHLFAGTPTRAWLDHTFVTLFGLPHRLSAATADRAYDHIAERLADPAFRPRALFERFNIAVLATTDAATDDLRHHARLHAEGWAGRVVPTFRPDALFQLAAPGWVDQRHALAACVDADVGTYAAFREALWQRRQFFRSMGATATDHAVVTPVAQRLQPAACEALYQRACTGRAAPHDQDAFTAHMLMEMAEMSTQDGLVMQLHAGSLRNHNTPLYDRFGADKGADIPVPTTYTQNLQPLLTAFGNDPRFRLILFTLDETTYARELAPLAGHYPAVRLGPAWWFHDSIEGMDRYRRQTTETAGFYNTAGFNDDTRAFCSIPARHDVARRVDANYLARLVATHQLDLPEAHRLARLLAGELARSTYRLDRGAA